MRVVLFINQINHRMINLIFSLYDINIAITITEGLVGEIKICTINCGKCFQKRSLSRILDQRSSSPGIIKFRKIVVKCFKNVLCCSILLKPYNSEQ